MAIRYQVRSPARLGDPSDFYRAHIFVCTNERPENHPRGSCARKGAEKLRNYMKARAKELGMGLEDGVRVNNAGCLERCELGPTIVIYPEGIWYRADSFADIDEILETHVKNGGRVERLLLRPEDGPDHSEKKK
ncbi:(2Fe-2S) ferredoxin domain-containing protein [Ferrovibrio sp.]|uniref:(2Fe-2S) ferredoxin domain-containing protein n=1 Tax=Ferrovibrio sp. TaxID=1917215 RepID=UPI000CB6F479|nr:(2Fe-2S) ferredoxin domain-containing protein [Ferrovibrio sp.]PJI38480.1 MAG: ferredoxin [Ferrovibrio sp.]